MLALYELLDLLPPKFIPELSPRLHNLCVFLREHERMEESLAAKKYLGDMKRLKYFNNLKNELKKNLTNILIANPEMGSQHYTASYEEAYRNFAAYKLLLTKGKRNAGIELAKSLLSKLQQAEFLGLAHLVAYDLAFHYSTMQIKPTLARKYSLKAQVFLEKTRAASIVREYHIQVTLICNNRESFSPLQIQELQQAVEHTVPLLQLGIHQINRLIYTIMVARYLATSDYPNIIKSCDEALANFSDNHPNKRSLRFSFLHKKIPALVALGRMEEAKEVAKETCQLVSPGGYNWHVALIKRVVVCFHADDYQEAYELYKAFQQQRCDFEALMEFWKILQGYIYFLIKRGKIAPYANEKFYLGKFLNEVPIYSQDKAGQNINILLIQILIRIQREQFGLIIDRIESLNQYVRTYTRNPETKRANLFIRMIVKMEAAHFNRTGTELRTKKLARQLSEVPLKLGQNLAIEIIPYAVLWEEVLVMLEEKFKGKKGRRGVLTKSKRK